MPKLTQTRIQADTGFLYYVKPEGKGPTINNITGVVDGVDSTTDLEGLPAAFGLSPNSNNPYFYYTMSSMRGIGVLPAPFSFGLANNGGGGPQSIATILPGPIASVLANTGTGRSLVGHPIMIYSVPQIVRVTYPAESAFGGLFLDNYPVNRTDFRLVRGVQNEIQFYVRDVDRKPVPLGISETLTINISEPATNTWLMSRNLTTIDNAQGIYLLTILPQEMNDWPTMPMRWSLTYNRADGTSVIMWTDREYSPYSTCNITESPVPPPTLSQTLGTIWAEFSLLGDSNYYSPAFPGTAQNGFLRGMQTFLITMSNFTGTIRIDASIALAPVNDDVSTDWFSVDTRTYTSNSIPDVFNEAGSYLWMRIVVTAVSGNPVAVQYKK